METELLIAYRLGYLDAKAYAETRTMLDSIGRMIVGLSNHLKGKITSDKG